MNMKSKVLATALFAAIGAASFGAQAAPSDSVTLQGIITLTTCDVTINGGSSTLFVGTEKASAFTAMTQLGSTPMPVLIDNCTANETGDLVITGTTASADPSNTLFVGNVADTAGFMIQESVTNSQMAHFTVNPGANVAVTAGTPTTYTFNVGLGSTVAPATPGLYSAPILISYYVN